MAAALAAGALSADAVALEARKSDIDDDCTSTTSVSSPSAVVQSLTARRMAHLPTDPRPMPSLTAYDALLRRRPTTAGTQPS